VHQADIFESRDVPPPRFYAGGSIHVAVSRGTSEALAKFLEIDVNGMQTTTTMLSSRCITLSAYSVKSRLDSMIPYLNSATFSAQRQQSGQS
jgi:hypothetical protein